MSNFFYVQDRPDLGGVMMTRILDPAEAYQAENVIYVADPEVIAGTWQPLPTVCEKINVGSMVNKMAKFAPYGS